MRTLAIVFLLAFVVAACRDQRASSVVSSEVFSGRGRIEHVDSEHASLEIHHERISSVRGFDGKLGPMESMTMPFAATDSAKLHGLAPGDVVQFDFTVHYEADPTLRLARIQKLAPDTKLTLP